MGGGGINTVIFSSHGVVTHMSYFRFKCIKMVFTVSWAGHLLILSRVEDTKSGANYHLLM